MQSKISWFNREIIFQIGRSVGWIGIIYFLALLFALPLQVLMRLSSEYPSQLRVVRLFQFHFEIQIVLMLVIPVLLSVFLFRFLQVKSSTDLIHSLPIKRDKIFHHYALSGLAVLVLPVLLTGVIMAILHSTLGLEKYFQLSDISSWIGSTVLVNLLIYMAGILVGMLTGISAVQGVLTYIFLLFPAGILVLLFYNLNFLLYGFPYDYYLNQDFEKYSPLIQAGVLESQSIDSKSVLIYFILMVLFYGLSLWIYKHRKLEAVSQAIAFHKLNPVFKYGTAFCTMLLGGLYFGEMQQTPGWIIFGYIAGSLIGYFAAEMVLQKSWRVLGKLKGYVMYAAAAAVLIAAFQFGFTNYERTIPAVDEIEKVYFSNDLYSYLKPEEDTNGRFFLKDPSNVQAIRALHEQIITNHNQVNPEKPMTEPAIFIYELKNGKKVIRRYEVNKADYAPFYKPIYESEEYKLATKEILKVQNQKVDKITIMPKGPINKRAVFTTPEDIMETIEILKAEAANETYEDMTNTKEPVANVDLLLQNNKRIMVEWKPSYKKFEKWLDQKGQLENARITAEDIAYALVAKRENVDPNYDIEPQDYFRKLAKSSKTLKITNKEDIEESLENTSWNEGTYMVAFYYVEQDFPDVRNFDDKTVPDFIKEHFEK